MREALDLFLLACETLYPIGLLVIAVRGFALWVTDRLRVTDWLGYIVHGLFLVGAPLRLWEMFGAWGVVPAALGVVGGLVWAHRGRAVLARRADGDDGTVLGFFLVSRKHVPEPVRNWFD